MRSKPRMMAWLPKRSMGSRSPSSCSHSFVAAGSRSAAGFGAVVALGLSAQTAVAHVGGQPTGAAPTTDLTSLSPACMAALQAIRSAIVADRQEDADEAQNPAAAAGEASEDSTEAAQFQPLIANLKSGCAAEIAALKPAVTTKPVTAPSVSAQCTSAVQAWKAYAKSLWIQGSAPTAAQQTALRQLGLAVRTACGWPAGEWSSGR